MPEPDRTESVSPDVPVPAPVRVLDPGTCLGQRYEIRRVLGVGGYAVVYLAHDRELRREVALKVLRADRMGPGALARLRREAAVARDAASPRLVRVFDIGVSDAAVYLTLEVVPGESLRERLARGPLPVEEAAALAAQVLEGLRVLHGLGIVHRDVKPGNVLLEPDGGVKLADFGLAFPFEREETRLTVGDGVLGTLDYVSPEQALGDEVDPRSDLYSLGVVLYEMLTGELPHAGRTSLGSVLGRLSARAPDVRRLRPEVPAWLASVVAGLLEKDRGRRYPSASAVLADLAAHSLPRTRAWRRRAVRWTATAAVMLALAGAVWGWTLWHRPRFSHLVGLEGGGLRAVDTEGREMWRKPGFEVGLSFDDLHLRGDRHRYLAGVLRPHGVFDARWVNVLSILDAETGEIVRQESLPSAAESFPGFSNQYGTVVRTYDLDGDGTDEVFVTYAHSPWWPSYTVLYEPNRRLARILFIGSGRHQVVGVEDLDGDGRAEVILYGINNRMGWYSAMAAVKVIPWVGEAAPERDSMARAGSPDEAYVPSSDSLLWYALGPRDLPDNPGRMDVHRDRRTLAFYYHGRPRVEVGYDGFLRPSPSPRPARERQAWREAAYVHLREAMRLLRAGSPAEALPESEEAARLAGLAAEPYLEEWASRVRGKALIAAGRPAEGEALFRTLYGIPETGAEAAYDAGRAFHLHGRLASAVRWYRRGLGTGARKDAGRGKYEYLEGLVFALGELGRWEEAEAEVERFQRAYPTDSPQGIYREYVRWRTGEPPSLDERDMEMDSTDLARYWKLELRWAHGVEPQSLLEAVAQESRRTTETRAYLLSLRGEILGRLGRGAEALAAHQEALRQTRGLLTVEPAARAHYDLVTARYAAAARRAGQAREAGAALAELARWQERRRRENG